MKISAIDRLLYLVFQKERLDLNKSFVKLELLFSEQFSSMLNYETSKKFFALPFMLNSLYLMMIEGKLNCAWNLIKESSPHSRDGRSVKKKLSWVPIRSESDATRGGGGGRGKGYSILSHNRKTVE